MNRQKSVVPFYNKNVKKHLVTTINCGFFRVFFIKKFTFLLTLDKLRYIFIKTIDH